MNEEPKSIWKKSWKGPGAVVGWFVLVACATFTVVFPLGLLSANKSIKESLTFSLLVSVGMSAALALLFALFRWLRWWRNLRRALFALVCLATLIGIFYAEEIWRGRHAWEKYKREQEAKGERFDLKSIAPPPVPDDQNFAMTPLWVEEISGMMAAEKARKWYGDKVAALGHTNFVRPLEMPVEFFWKTPVTPPNPSGDWQKGEKTDLKVWQEYYRQLAPFTNFFPIPPQPRTPAEDVLLALSKYDSAIEELRAASKLPYSRFPLGYADDDPAGILLPHLSSLRGCLRALQLRSSAELQSGETEKALEDVKLMLRLTQAIHQEPITISHLVRIAMLQIDLQTVWEGLAGHHWKDAQLAALTIELGKLDFLADYNFSMRGERVFDVGLIDYLRRNRRAIEDIMRPNGGDSSNRPKATALDRIMYSPINRLVPGGWFDQNKVNICRTLDEYSLPIVNLETRTVALAAVKRTDEAGRRVAANATPFNWFTHLAFSLGDFPPFENVSLRFAHAQSSTDLARIACALERYRLAHGTFPETLEALTPQFMEKIPRDIIGGQPLKYRRTADGQFVLYSVGWNGTDDGGQIVLTKGKTPSVDPKQGDWVWQYPTK